jgi:thiamine biosynthesis lipoprotein
VHLPDRPPVDREPRSIDRRNLFTGRARPESPYWVRVHRAAMACRFEVTLSGEDADRVGRVQQALAEAARLEARLSVFRDESELSLVNRSAGARPVAVSRELFDLLRRCHELHAETDGTFDITSTPLSRCWGFLKRQGRVPDPDALDAARRCVGMPHVILESHSRSVSFDRDGVELNLGSIGKGYAVDRVTALLGRVGVTHALVSAGGSSVRALGGRAAWTIDLTSRRRTAGRIARLRLRRGALATSGAGEQYVDAAGTRYGHVLDPRSGWPAQGLLSVSVVAADAATADALATAFLVGGEDLARRYCAAHPDTLAFLTLDRPDARTIVVGSHQGLEGSEL